MNSKGSDDSGYPEPIIEARKGISIIWLLPLIAAAIGGWLIYKAIVEAGVDIYITFDSAEGIEEGKTRVMYKGLTGGVVKEIHINDDLKTVTVRAEMIPDAKNGLRENTLFWLVKPKVSFTGVSGLETLVSGNYIAVQPGDGEFTRNFKALSKPPPLSESAPGLHIKLIANELGSVDRGSLVYYREIPVGDVQDYQLAENDDGVVINLHIHEEFQHLVKHNSRFWNASGITVKASLSGVQFRMESLSSLVAGGIAFFSPDPEAASAGNGDRFRLFEDYDAAEAGIMVKIRFADGVGLEEGRTEVRFNDLAIGVVKKLHFDDQFRGVAAEVLFDPLAAKLLKDGARFWIVRPRISLGALSDLNRLVAGRYIAMLPGQGAPKREFSALTEAPSPTTDLPGLHLRLKAAELGSLELGSPVLYKKMQVGEVRDYRLATDGGEIEISLVIEPRYAHLVRGNSRFWINSGIQLNADFKGLDLRVGSVASILAGGITFFTPPSKSLPTAKSGAEFPLYPDYSSATENGSLLYSRQSPGLHLTLRAPELGSLGEGSPILYKKIPVGEVKGYRLDPVTDQVLIFAHIRAPYATLVRNNTRFWNASGVRVTAALSGLKLKTESVESLIKGGIGFFTPAGDAGSAGNGDSFSLFADYEAAMRESLAIELHFDSAEGLGEGTSIKYRGLVVGEVSALDLAETGAKVVAKAVLFGPGIQLAREGSLFWRVGPTLRLSRVEHLDTLVSGSYIEVLPGSGEMKRVFDGLPKPPLANPDGLALTLEADRLGSLVAGSPIYYRQIPVGEVSGYELSPWAQRVLIHIQIDRRYAPLLRKNTKFWNVSGVAINLGLLSGLRVEAESVQALLGGGIAFATPEAEAMGGPALSGDVFRLYDVAQAEWKAWRPDIHLAAE